MATTTEVGFLERDSRHLQLDPLEDGQHALYIATPDGEGITLIGTTEELLVFSERLNAHLAFKAGQEVGWGGETINCGTPLWQEPPTGPGVTQHL